MTFPFLSPVKILTTVTVLSSLLFVYGQSTDFQGPGYLTCPAEEYELQQCSTIDLDPNVCSAEALQYCNFTQVVPTFDDTRTTIIISLVCECVVALGCPGSCSFAMGALANTTSPPVISAGANFTGVGSVTCPYEDYFSAKCTPTILNNDLTSCGSCDPTILDQNFGYQQGDESITLPLPCTCSILDNCPVTCNFTAGILTGAPTTPVDSTPVPTPVDLTGVPIAVPSVGNNTAPSPLAVPTGAEPIVPVNNSNNNNTSAANTYGILCRIMLIVMMVPILLMSF